MSSVILKQKLKNSDTGGKGGQKMLISPTMKLRPFSQSRPLQPKLNVAKNNGAVKSQSNLLQQISCTAEPDVQQSNRIRKGVNARENIIHQKHTPENGQKIAARKPPSGKTPIKHLSAPGKLSDVDKDFRKDIKKDISRSTSTNTVRKQCLCAACTRKRGPADSGNDHNEILVSVTANGALDKAATTRKSATPQVVKKSTTESRSAQKEAKATSGNPKIPIVKENHEINKELENNGPVTFLKNFFAKSSDVKKNTSSPNVQEMTKSDQGVTKKLKTDTESNKNVEDVFSQFVTAVSSVSLNMPDAGREQSPFDFFEREVSLMTRCDSFNFVEMPLDKGMSNDDGLFFNLKDATSKNEVIRSKLGSRAGDRQQDVIEWKKGDILGRGAFGTVWAGLTITGELIAVKQAEISSVDMEKAKKEYEKVQLEVELLKSLHHKNIVGYLGTSLNGRIVSIFMQYVPGGSLYLIMKKFGCLAEQVISRYTKQILDGVSYLHSKHVIHRDIKGSNIMLAHNGIIKLIDFGCARKLMAITKSNEEILKSMKGTPYWMAPEVINETGHGKKSDVWSIGCTVFEMATTKPPWSELNRFAALFAISNSMNTVPQLPTKFSSDAKDFVCFCLKRDPTARPYVEKLLEHRFIIQYCQSDTRIQDSRGVPTNSNKKL